MSSTPDRLRVLVACEHALIADTVRAALASGGHDVVAIGWPTVDEQPARGPTPDARPGLPQVGLLMCDLDELTTVHTAVSLVADVDVPWVVLTGSRRGAGWGALLEAGVEVVRGKDVRLEQISDLLVDVARHRVGTPARERDELTLAWREEHAHHCA
jgi:hypothetical protein